MRFSPVHLVAVVAGLAALLLILQLEVITIAFERPGLSSGASLLALAALCSGVVPGALGLSVLSLSSLARRVLARGYSQRPGRVDGPAGAAKVIEGSCVRVEQQRHPA